MLISRKLAPVPVRNLLSLHGGGGYNGGELKNGLEGKSGMLG